MPTPSGRFCVKRAKPTTITIEDAVAALRIRQPILEAFEAGEFEIKGVPEIQVRGMLRIYGRFLELTRKMCCSSMIRCGWRRRRDGADVGSEGGGEDTRAGPLSSTQPMLEMQLAERRASTTCRQPAAGTAAPAFFGGGDRHHRLCDD